MKQKQKNTSNPPYKLLLIVLIVILLIGILMGLAGLSLSPRINTKVILDLPYSTDMAWGIVAENDSQVFWRTNLVNIEKVKETNNRTFWREIYSNDTETIYEVSEYIPGKKIVKTYRGSNGLNDIFTIIIQPSAQGSRTAFIQSLSIPNPFLRLFIKTGLINKKNEFNRLNEYMALLTAEMKKRGTPILTPAVTAQDNIQK